MGYDEWGRMISVESCLPQGYASSVVVFNSEIL